MSRALICVLLAAGCEYPSSPQGKNSRGRESAEEDRDHEWRQATCRDRRGRAEAVPVESCATEIAPAVPAANSRDAYYRANVEVTLTNGAGDEDIAVYDASGRRVSGLRVNDGTNLTYELDAPLEPSSPYTVCVAYCGTTIEYEFSTGYLGASPLPDADLHAGAYVLDLDAARFIEPTGVAELLLGQLEVTPTLEVVASGPGRLDVLMGWSDGGQDACQPTVGPAPAASFEEPSFVLDLGKVALHGASGVVDVDAVRLEGTFAPDGTTLGGGVLSGRFDARQNVDWAGGALGVADEDALCDALAGFGVACEECPDGAAYCVDLHADHVTATQDETLALVPITESDIAANPDCAAE